PGGPNVELAARRGNPRAYELPRPLLGRPPKEAGRADFSFSGLKTAVRQLAAGASLNIEDACARFQAAVDDILTDRTQAAMEMFRRDFGGEHRPGKVETGFPSGRATQNSVLVVAGGVAANQAIGAALKRLAEREGFGLGIPVPALCTDNAAMIAWA